MAKGRGIKAITELAAQMKARKQREERQRRARAKGKEPANDTGELVNSFTAQHGDYDRNLRHVVNRGGTAVDRWKRDGMLSETQQAAILHMIRLWELTDSSARLVANLDRTVFGCPGDGNLAEIEARRDLHRIIDYFPHPIDCYYAIFENCCRFDEPAGVAGSRLAGGDRTGPRAALTVVQFVADIIYQKERLSY